MKPYTYRPFIENVPELSMIFDALASELQWVQREAPRKEYWTNSLGRPYTYGRGAGERTYESQPSHRLIDAAADLLEIELGFRYEGCFLNFYKDEHDSLGWHADDDPGINHSRPIAVITFGAARDIMIRPQFTENEIVAGLGTLVKDQRQIDRVTLEPGSILLMHAGMQQTHQHRIPKGSRACGPRISLTFRSLLH